MSNQSLQQRKDNATPRGITVMCPFHADQAGNAEPWDTEGRRYIDFAAGIAVLDTGHRHPRVVAAIRFLFPLTIEDCTFEEGLGILEAALRQQ
ncbi:MAG: aminotransferase class III-fold pyridoxal phosphate-dependent enzyme [Desulfovibrionaceae bacterium]|jgi:4-aminobutyrate aminotransferase-like enzyme|nr:aminotransferase class III-fold pyridoxal phosphate-dependent enzyme [Desulfovibrionaceae bacterium]